MASQAAATDLSTTASVEVEKEVQSYVEKPEGENVSPPKEGVENSKPQDSPCPELVHSTDSEATINEEKFEAPVTEDVKDVISGVEPEADSAVAPAPLLESAGNKIEDTPVVEAFDKDIHIVAKETVPEPNPASVLEPTAEKAECKLDDKSETRPTEKQGDELKLQPIEGKTEEPGKEIDVPGSISSPIDVVMENTEELPAKAGVTTEVKDDTVPEVEGEPENTSVPAPVITEQAKKEPRESEPVELVEVRSATENVEDNNKVKENETSSIESSEHVKSVEPITQVEEKDLERSPTDEVPKETGEENEEKKSAEETVVELGKTEVEGEAPEAKSEDKSSIRQKIEDKLNEPPSIEEEKKTEDALIMEASDKVSHEVEKVPVPEPNTVETKPAKKQGEESKLESLENKTEERVHKSSEANIVEEKVEKAEELPAKFVEATDAIGERVSVVVCQTEETLDHAPTVEEKPYEKSEVAEQIEKEPPETELAQKSDFKTVEDTSLRKEDENSINVKSDTLAVEEKEPVKETVVTLEKTEGGTEAPEEKIEEKSPVAEEKPIVDATTSIPLSELLEKAAEEDVTSRQTEMVAENGNTENGTSASAETTNADVKEKAYPEENKEAQESEAAVKIEGTVKSTEPKLEGEKEVREEEEKSLQATEAKLEEEKEVREEEEKRLQATEAKLEEDEQVNEPAKTEVHQPKCVEDNEDTKTTLDAPKEDVPVKTQKQSIVKMVKQSLSKAKKAIIGKSHHSKTSVSEPKDDGNE